MNKLIAEICLHPDFKKIKGCFSQREQDLLTGISGSQKTTIIAGLTYDLAKKTLIISHSNNQAYRISLDLEGLIGKGQIAFFPANELFPHEEAYEPEVTAQRVATLGRSLTSDRLIVVTSWEAIQRRLIPPNKFLEFTLFLNLGMETSTNDLLEKLVKMGFQRVDMVQSIGQFSKRGDLVDVYPLDQPNPVRIEFFGDEIDSIRIFKVEDQISIGTLQELLILPAREGLWFQEDFESAKETVLRDLENQVAKLEEFGKITEAEALRNKIVEALERLSQGLQVPGADQFLPWVEKNLVSLLDYLEDTYIILDEPVRGYEAYRSLEEEHVNILANFLERGVILPKEQEFFLNSQELDKAIWTRKPWSLSLLAKTPKGIVPRNVLNLPFKSAPTFHSKTEALAKELNHWLKGNQILILAVSTRDKARRLKEVLREQGIASIIVGDSPEPELIPGTVRIEVLDLESGFEWIPGKILVLTESEIYGRQKKRYQAKFQQEGIKISSFSDLKVGDYVVHINHGIGRFMGLETLEIAGSHRDYLKIEYAGEDRLFVPTDQVNLLQKYIGIEDSAPKLSKMGGSDWQKVKNRVKESIRDMAEELLDLYARREVAPGHCFGPDTVWQHEFEESFFYEETPDQIRTIIEIKKDMESSKPMDRLVCGDVGYGKTEVAMRAAFKAIMDGKQVGILVPTTILAQQHFLTFRERFAGYPINIKVISRFQSAKDQADTISGLLEGEVDLVIGTHRLLSTDLHFKDLGLLIIDEEQRFGVAHKEKLKELRQNVDVLTLTATPIPRTLHMSLAGLRDISIIETAPQGRFPIRTHVLEFNEEVIREAIQRELDRQGQIYFVYNRVETIERMAGYLQNLLPRARVSIAHGQMEEDSLERVMLDFYDYQSDILVCTTIIETGLDIPNVNTLIVYDADRFGLAQLYQLRGRVGRSNRLAHAYFCYRKDKTLSENAEKRLAAIREFTDLGSGFKIAMRDLEIRGAGNLLGAEQHGQVAAVGFELYCRLLEEAIREKKGEVAPELPDPIIEIPVDAYVPSQYINDNKQKVEIYRKVANVSSLESIDRIIDELIDRFGEPPQPVINLLNIAKIKILAKMIGFASLGKERNEFIGKLHIGLGVDYDKILQILHKYRNHFRYQPGRPPVFRWKAGLPEPELIKMILNSFEWLK